VGLATLIVATAGTADARTRHHRSHHRAAASSAGAYSYNPPVSTMVVDANSGVVLEATNPDAPRHPASLTKMMTLYLLFERLQQGKMTLASRMPVSAHAAAQAPSKLGLKPGDSISVEHAIEAIVTKSANDVAVVISEAIGGDEPSFARMMTAKAHQLGMTHTSYHNASGLPDEAQITTARDQSIIARALRDRFPQYYHFFSTKAFAFRGHTIRGHNHLLGNVDGVDGLKTGYIRESGFNIVTSVHRGNHYLIAVMFGGRTARARDARVEALIDQNFAKTAANRTAPLVREGWESTPVAKVEPKAGPKVEAAMEAIKREPVEEAKAAHDEVAAAEMPEPGSTAPIKPVPVHTFTVRPGTFQTASLTPPAPDAHRIAPAPAAARAMRVTEVPTVKAETPLPPAPRPATAKVASASATVPLPATNEASAKTHSGWMIQVGAFDDEKEARQRLDAVQDKIKSVLGKADPFTEKVDHGKKTFYRARFAGMEKDQAEAACKHLKHTDIPCMMLKN
jgi:D-alanyl-D-alanine carboxypeptidase